MKTLCEWGGTSVEHTSRCSIRTVTERHGSVITVRSVQQPKFTEDQLQTLASQTTDLTEDVRTWLSGLTSKKPSGMAEESQQSDTRLICQDRKASRGLRLALSGQLSARHNAGMHIRRSRYLRHRFPPEIISHAVWLYHRYCLSFRDGIVKLLVNALTLSPICCSESSSRAQQLGGWTRQFRSS